MPNNHSREGHRQDVKPFPGTTSLEHLSKEPARPVLFPQHGVSTRAGCPAGAGDCIICKADALHEPGLGATITGDYPAAAGSLTQAVAL